MKKWEIKDRRGVVLYQGEAPTKREFLEDLFRNEVSFAGADMRRFDLSGMFIEHIDLDGADLTGADLRGAHLEEASLKGAILKNAKLQGARLERAYLQSADLTGANLAGSRATYANFRGATLNEADLTSMSGSSTVFSRVRAKNAKFIGAGLVNSDFGNSEILSCDFSGADLGHRMFGEKDERISNDLARHLPNRSRYAVVVGCDFDKESNLPETVPAFRRDRRTGKLAEFGLWSATTLGMIAIGTQVPVDFLAETALSSRLGTGSGFIVSIGAVYLLKEKIGGWLEDGFTGSMKKVVQGAQQGINALHRWGAHRKDIVAAIASRGADDMLKQALTATGQEAAAQGALGRFKSFFTDLGQVILCNRTHLSLALGALSSNRQRNYKLRDNIVLVRADTDKDSPAPNVMGFLKDGRTTATWKTGDNSLTLLYDGEDELVGAWNEKGEALDYRDIDLPECAAHGLTAVSAFERQILDDNGLEEFIYPDKTHHLHSGRDGTIFVHRTKDRRLDNPEDGAPALIQTDNTGLQVKNGSIRGEWTLSNG